MSLSEVENSDPVSLITRSPDETFDLGRAVGKAARPGTVLCLFGDLGSGKTRLTQGVAAGLSVPESYAVTSPTFTYVNEYPGRLPLFHVDLYRVSSPEQLFDIGWEEFISNGGVVVVEWAERAGDLLPNDRVEAHIEVLGEEERGFLFSFFGEYDVLRTAIEVFKGK